MSPRSVCRSVLSRYTGDVAILFLLLASFSVLYFWIAHDFQRLPGYSIYRNILFGADHTDALMGWVSKHKGIHPLVLFIVVPASWFFSLITSDYEFGLLIFAALVGGTTVSAFYALCRMLVGRSSSLVMASFFGLSMNQIVFSSIPDTYVLVALSLIPSFALSVYCLKKKKVYFPVWPVVGLLSFGVTITSLIVTLVCLTVVLLRLESVRDSAKGLVYFLIIVLASGVVLSLAQAWLIPGARYFFTAHPYKHEMQYVSPLIFERPGFFLLEVLKTFFIYNFLGLQPLVTKFVPGLQLKLVYFGAPIKYGGLGMCALVLWIVLFMRGVFQNFRDPLTRSFTVAVSLSVLVSVCIHSVFTDEMYLYTPHFSFIVLLLCLSRGNLQGRRLKIIWWGLTLLVGINNLSVIHDILSKFGGEIPTRIIRKGDNWRYFPGTSSPSSDWTSQEFDDSRWRVGPSGFGYGDYDDATLLSDMESHYTTVFTRTQFDVPNIKTVSWVFIDVDYDDGFVVYLNSKRILSRNAPEAISQGSRATHLHEAGSPVRYRVPRDYLAQGRNTIAVVGLNREVSSSDLTLLVQLSLVRGSSS